MVSQDVKNIFQGLSIETNKFLLTSKLYLVFKVLVKIAKSEENSRLLTLTLATFKVKIALGLESTFTDG